MIWESLDGKWKNPHRFSSVYQPFSLRYFVFLPFTIQNHFQMNLIRDSGNQLGLGPTELPGCPEILFPELHRQLGFHDHNILRPAQLHRQGHRSRMVFIGAVEIPHPAQVPGREAMNLRILGSDVF